MKACNATLNKRQKQLVKCIFGEHLFFYHIWTIQLVNCVCFVAFLQLFSHHRSVTMRHVYVILKVRQTRDLYFFYLLAIFIQQPFVYY